MRAERILIFGLIACVVVMALIIRDHSREVGQLKCRITMYEDGSSEFRDGEEAMRCLYP